MHEASLELLKLISENDNMFIQFDNIQQLEHQADSITHHCIEELHKTFITPFQRDEIYRLITKMDDVIDFIEDIARSIIIYKIPEKGESMKELAMCLLNSTIQLKTLAYSLRSLNNREEMRKSFDEILKLEHKADTLYFQAIEELFESSDTKLIIKYKEIYDSLENAVDRCRDVSNIIEGVLLEST